MELVDVPDSKSGGVHAPCRFDPDHRQINKVPLKRGFIYLFGYWKKRVRVGSRVASRGYSAEQNNPVNCFARGRILAVPYGTKAKMRNAVYCEQLKTDPDHKYFICRVKFILRNFHLLFFNKFTSANLHR